MINHLYINGAKVNISASLMLGKTLTTKLGDIHLRDIGKKSGGATPGEVAEQIISAISKSASKAAGQLDLSQIGITSLEVLGGGAKTTLETVGKTVGGGAKDVLDKGVGAIGGALKGLLGN